MTKHDLPALFPLALLVASGSLHAEIAEINWIGAAQSAHEFRIQPTKFAEWCGKLKADDKVKWRFEATAPVNFNIHYHQGKDVHYPARQDGVATAEGLLDVSVAQDYCWMWSNKSGNPVTVKVSASKAR